jgi:hypothetical protein
MNVRSVLSGKHRQTNSSCTQTLLVFDLRGAEVVDKSGDGLTGKGLL